MPQSPKTRDLIMKTFTNYVKLMEAGELDAPENQDDLLVKLVRLAWKRYAQEAKDFFSQLGNKDPDIKELLTKIERPSEELSAADRVEGDVKDDFDVVAPSAADTSPGLTDE
jgi:hypothetical protein